MERTPTQKSSCFPGRTKSVARLRRVKPIAPVMLTDSSISSFCSMSQSASTSAHAQQVSHPFTSGINYSNDENLAFNPKQTDGSTTHANCRIPKSRTVTTFSSTTMSRSRGSRLSQGYTSSRNISGESVNSDIAAPFQRSIRTSFLGVAQKPSTSTPDQPRNDQDPGAIPRPLQPWSTPEPSDPRFVTKAMPAPYWTGRYTSIHDMFCNELLAPDALGSLIEAHVDGGSMHDPHVSAFMRVVRKPILNNHKTPTTTRTSRIPQSATSGAILQRSAAQLGHGEAPSSSSRVHAVSSNTSRSNKPAGRESNIQFKKNSAATVSRADDVALCHRTLAHLGKQCITDEARESFRAWRVLYARMRRDVTLLPAETNIFDLVVTGQDNILLRVEALVPEEIGAAWGDKGRGIMGRLKRNFSGASFSAE
ncbi:hypothetical protein N656DRAFT_183066 [Canariomyces notabilis]|uniref:Uncharacterized protein n=1 Tax=Canariomyces notabilis TaxID=2074819 RepID=A0AAN6QMG2_9PEZI|nr:hypothetical protein N656DRAFT_183066 [Canariomyces arenarius]